jgi:diguanylate cyclase (GGDEF)-like protein
MAIERKRVEEKLKYSSTHEPLTGLYNRGYYEEEIKRLNSGRQSPVGSIVIDIDRLKYVNEQYGHSAGDELLIAFANVLKNEFRSGDVVSRLGGDEFGILLPLSNMKTVEKAVKRIEKSVDHYNLNNPRVPIFYSVGCCTTEDGRSVLDAINQADSLMYRHKASKRKQRE